jgi:hypothetical protein
MTGDRHSFTEARDLITDPDEIARRETENGVRQFEQALEIIRSHVKEPDRPFRLRPFLILKLNEAALHGIHPLAGTFRNTTIKISKSRHVPPDPFMVSEEVSLLCDYIKPAARRFTLLRMCCGGSIGYTLSPTATGVRRVRSPTS